MLKKLTIPILVACIVMVAGSGCAMPKDWYEPEFKASYSPVWGFSLRNTKDFHGSAKITKDPETGEITGFEVIIDDNASSVNESQVALMEQYKDQMVEFNEQLKTHGKNLEMLAIQANNALNTAAGVLNFKATPDGVQAGNALAPARDPANE